MGRSWHRHSNANGTSCMEEVTGGVFFQRLMDVHDTPTPTPTHNPTDMRSTRSTDTHLPNGESSATRNPSLMLIRVSPTHRPTAARMTTTTPARRASHLPQTRTIVKNDAFSSMAGKVGAPRPDCRWLVVKEFSVDSGHASTHTVHSISWEKTPRTTSSRSPRRFTWHSGPRPLHRALRTFIFESRRCVAPAWPSTSTHPHRHSPTFGTAHTHGHGHPRDWISLGHQMNALSLKSTAMEVVYRLLPFCV